MSAAESVVADELAQSLVARQPILDRNQKLFSYELLFRSSVENSFPLIDGDLATTRLVDTSLFTIGLERLAGGRPAFINATRNILMGDVVRALPPDRVVLEILETVTLDETVIDSCRALKAEGYRLALDDYTPARNIDNLLPLLDILKVDFMETETDELRKFVAGRGAGGPLLLAEKIETPADFDLALSLGFDYFQGYFFCRPQIVPGQEIPIRKANHVRFLQEVCRPEIDLQRVETIIKQELSLSLRLLRYVNSWVFGVSRRIDSLNRALLMLGERPLRRWGSLAAVVGLCESKPRALLNLSLCRARFCELVGARMNPPLGEPESFLTGLLSALDVLLDRSFDQILKQLRLPEEIEGALLGRDGRLSKLLELAVAVETADWAAVDRLASHAGLDAAELADAYRESVEWADGLGIG